ncbi:ER lumen protein retaining receptor (macronuclear) [Tetrahymena thermophila SB210]|uniref:ER lumen protein retaining receptor n=1 Tax=Tetrahymena thermophila (strain SB210) TaxID=312017 RepID=Q23QZ9_TETTS|nr:ER lumen protein retaining receptor [Tetrahymena thermophila SB210]EAR98957.1 ER lumen protein retaining receptor [Tetrahymena thermophila SB210]|eukprot:XP_001019202.1 ER lumen protein retaining receptor [Tetrahymena thermophila SB210]
MELVLLLFLLGYVIQDAGCVILLLRILKQRSVDGLSLQSQVMYGLGTLMRVIYTFDTRLSNYTIVFVEMMVAVLLHIGILYGFFKYRYTQTSDIQSPLISWKTIIPVCSVLAYFFHPGEQYEYLQILVSLSMFIEAVGLLPQIYVNRKQGRVEYELGKYLIFMVASRIARLAFWFVMYRMGDQNIELMVADIVHTVLLADFAILFIKNKGKEVILVI